MGEIPSHIKIYNNVVAYMVVYKMEKDTFIYLDCFVSHREPQDRKNDKSPKGVLRIIAKDKNGNLKVIKINMKYKVIVGSTTEQGKINFSIEMRSIMSKYKVSRIEEIDMGMCNMLFRKHGYVLLYKCGDYDTYIKLKNAITNIIRKNSSFGCFLCNASTDPESQLLLDMGIYGCEYITVEKDNGRTVKVRKATEDEIEGFDYRPVIAGFDMEMLLLDGLNPDCRPYMISYYVKNKTYVLYTEDFYSGELECEGIITISCRDALHMVEEWMKIVYKTRPDIITGYYIYHADMPMVHHILARDLRLPLRDKETNIVPYMDYTKKLDKRSEDSGRGMVLVLPGISVIDMYTCLLKIIPNEQQTSMSLEDVSNRYLGEGKEKVGYDKLHRNYYSKSIEDKLESITYAAKDAQLPVRLYEYFSIWQRHRALYTRTGVPMYKLLTSGSVIQVYGKLCITAKENNILIDEPISSGYTPGGGKVYEPKVGFYEDVCVVDFNSLYPNIVIAYNICPTNHYTSKEDIPEGKECWVLKDKYDREHYFVVDAKPLLPKMLKEMLESRDRIKNKLRTIKDHNSLEYIILDSAQLAEKDLANSVIGVFAETTSGTNPIVCTELNDVVTTTGRTLSEYIYKTAESMGLTVIYGDTDSLFLTPKSKVEEFLAKVHKTLEDNIRLKIEYTAKRFVITKKKHYICDLEDSIKIVGYKSVKSNSPPICRDIFKNVIRVMLRSSPDKGLELYSKIKEEYTRMLKDDMTLEELAQFCWKVKVTGKVLSETSAKRQLLDRLSKLGADVQTGNTILVTYVLTREEYEYTYKERAPEVLPSMYTSDSHRIKDTHRTYPIDVVKYCPRAIYVDMIIDKHCLTNIEEIYATMTNL